MAAAGKNVMEAYARGDGVVAARGVMGRQEYESAVK